MDEWKGLGVFRSDDASRWDKQPENLLAGAGKGADDQVKGGHPDVVVSRDRAFLFYFTHPGGRRSSIQVVELHEKNGWLTCERDEPTHILLRPQK